MSISIKIKNRRESLGLTQAMLADAVGVHRQTVSAWETGEKTPRGSSLHKLARALKVSFEWLSGVSEVGSLTSENVGHRIKIAREEIGMEIHELSRLAKMFPFELTKRENSNGHFNVSELIRIADALNVSWKWLKTGELPRRMSQNIDDKQRLAPPEKGVVIPHVLREKSPWVLPPRLANSLTHGFDRFGKTSWIEGEYINEEYTGCIAFLTDWQFDEEDLAKTIDDNYIIYWNDSPLHVGLYHEPGQGFNLFNGDVEEDDDPSEAFAFVDEGDLDVLGRQMGVISIESLKTSAISELQSDAENEGQKPSIVNQNTNVDINGIKFSKSQLITIFKSMLKEVEIVQFETCTTAQLTMAMSELAHVLEFLRSVDLANLETSCWIGDVLNISGLPTENKNNGNT